MSTEMLFLIPAKGLRVICPETRQPLPEEGALKAKSTYWLRRLVDGDVTEGKAPRPVRPAASISSKE
jgi:hypothetical protein